MNLAIAKLLMLVNLFLPSAIPQGFIYSGTVSGGSEIPSAVSGLQGWYEGDCISYSSGCQVPSNGSAITTWYDQSTNANVMTCTNSPTFQTNQVNGKPAVYFLSSSTQICSFTGVAWGGGISIFMVVESDGSSNPQTFLSGITNSFSYRLDASSLTQNVVKTDVANIGSSSTALSTNTFYEIDVTYSGTSAVFSLNHAANGTVSGTQTISANQSKFGADSDTGTAYLNGRVACLFWYNNVVSGTDKTKLQAYITGKYGL